MLIASRPVFLFLILVMPATAQTQRKPVAVPNVTGCLDRTADAVMTVRKSPEGYYFAHVESDGTAYHTDSAGCGYFVVDVVLPRGFRMDNPLASGIKISWQFGSSQALTESNCSNASLDALVYKKPYTPGANFDRIRQQRWQGVWSPARLETQALCLFGAWPGGNLLKIAVPKDGVVLTSVYRVLVLPKLDGQAKQARLDWHWQGY